MEEDNRFAENRKQIKLLQQILLEKRNGCGERFSWGEWRWERFPSPGLTWAWLSRPGKAHT